MRTAAYPAQPRRGTPVCTGRGGVPGVRARARPVLDVGPLFGDRLNPHPCPDVRPCRDEVAAAMRRATRTDSVAGTGRMRLVRLVGRADSWGHSRFSERNSCPNSRVRWSHRLSRSLATGFPRPPRHQASHTSVPIPAAIHGHIMRTISPRQTYPSHGGTSSRARGAYATVHSCRCPCSPRADERMPVLTPRRSMVFEGSGPHVAGNHLLRSRAGSLGGGRLDEEFWPGSPQTRGQARTWPGLGRPVGALTL
jgi:hypothetical protein